MSVPCWRLKWKSCKWAVKALGNRLQLYPRGDSLCDWCVLVGKHELQAYCMKRVIKPHKETGVLALLFALLQWPTSVWNQTKEKGRFLILLCAFYVGNLSWCIERKLLVQMWHSNMRMKTQWLQWWNRLLSNLEMLLCLDMVSIMYPFCLGE